VLRTLLRATRDRGAVGSAGSGRKTRYRGDVAEQRRAGDWLTGVLTAKSDSRYPGERLGLPQEGPRSVARMGRRLAALFADWLLCMVIAVAALHSQYWTIAIFAAEIYLLTALTGVTVGKRLLGIRVVRLDGRPVGFGWALVRTLLLLTVVPPLVTDGDLRGMHDRAANTAVIRI
jgi:RDD family